MISRRDLLMKSGMGFGALALSSLLPASLFAGDQAPRSLTSPLLPRKGHHVAKAKSVIFLFMEGGPSHIDLFDPKPVLNQLAGKPLPDSFGKVITAMGEARSPLLACKRTWNQHGQSGIWMSDWLPHLAGCADDLAVIRSCVADGINRQRPRDFPGRTHAPALNAPRRRRWRSQRVPQHDPRATAPRPEAAHHS